MTDQEFELNHRKFVRRTWKALLIGGCIFSSLLALLMIGGLIGGVIAFFRWLGA